jgi:hypothetical protein
LDVEKTSEKKTPEKQLRWEEEMVSKMEHLETVMVRLSLLPCSHSDMRQKLYVHGGMFSNFAVLYCSPIKSLQAHTSGVQ